VVDTVGAGDTFNAGVLAKLHELGVLQKAALKTLPADVLSQALAHGARVAAVTVSRAGANPPWANEL
jgi:fructokinase